MYPPNTSNYCRIKCDHNRVWRICPPACVGGKRSKTHNKFETIRTRPHTQNRASFKFIDNNIIECNRGLCTCVREKSSLKSLERVEYYNSNHKRVCTRTRESVQYVCIDIYYTAYKNIYARAVLMDFRDKKISDSPMLLPPPSMKNRRRFCLVRRLIMYVVI